MDNEVVDITGMLLSENTVVNIKNASGQDTGWKITLAGPSHPQVIEFADEQAKSGLQKQRLIEQAQVNGKKYHAEEKSPDQARRESIRWVTRRIIGWTPVKIGDKVWEYSQPNAEELFIKPELGAVLSQLTEAIGEDKRFMKPSA